MKLVTQGGVACNKLDIVSKTFNTLNSVQNGCSKPLLQHTSRQTADRLVLYKLYDLDVIETCWCIQNLFGPKSVFSIYHDESTESAIAFLVTSLSFKPDPSPDFEPVPDLHGGTLVRAICSSELSDKTAESAVHDAIIPSIFYLNEVLCTLSSHPTDLCNFCSIARRANSFRDSELETYYIGPL